MINKIKDILDEYEIVDLMDLYEFMLKWFISRWLRGHCFIGQSYTPLK